MPAKAWNVPQEELETLARAIGLPMVGGSWPAARHNARVLQFQQILDGERPAGWDGPGSVGAPLLPAARPAAAVAATFAAVDGDDDDEDDEEDTARCKEMFGMASQHQPWSHSQQSGTSLDEQLSATQPFEDSQSYSQGYSQELDGDDDGDEHSADTQQLSQASNAETLPYEMSQSLSQQLSDVEDEYEYEDGGTRSPILGDDVSDDDELFGPRASQSLSPSPPPKPPRLPTPIPMHGHTATRSPSVGRSGSDTPMSAPGTRSPPSSAEDRDKDLMRAQPLQRNDSNSAKAATAAVGPRGPFALAAAAAARARNRSASRSPSVGKSPTLAVVKPCPIKVDEPSAGSAGTSKTKPAVRRASGRSKTKIAAATGAASEAGSSIGNASCEPSAPSSASNQGTLDSFFAVRKRKPAAQPPAGSRLQATVGTVRSGGQPDTPPPQGADAGGVTAATDVGAAVSQLGDSTMGPRAPAVHLVAAAAPPAKAATSPSTKRSRSTTVTRGGQSRKAAKLVGFKAPRRLSEVQQLEQTGIHPRCTSSGAGVATSPATKRPRRSARR